MLNRLMKPFASLFENRKELYEKADYLFKTDILDPDKRADKLVELIF